MILVGIGKKDEREKLFQETLRIYSNLLKKPVSDGILSHLDSGKPIVSGRDDIKISLSHSGEYLVIALSSEEVGIDIQEKKGVDFQKIATRYGFTASTLDEFYAKFTLSEAQAKKSGQGLAPTLHQADLIDGKTYSFIPNYTLSVVGKGEAIFNVVE